jgi:hypothetical protein
MVEVVSFGNLVNALNVVRDDYNEHLKSVPQYEAFLLVESSTRKVVETLHEHVDSPAPSMAAEVISSLEIAKSKFKEHLKSVAEYRALLAIDKLIVEVSIDLGVVPAPAQPAVVQAALPEVEPEEPSQETAPVQPEPDLTVSAPAVSTLEPAIAQPEPMIAQPEAAEIASPHEAAATEPEPAVSEAAHMITQPETAEIAAPQPIAAAEPEPEIAASAADHATTQPEAAEIGSLHQEEATQEPTETEPDLVASAAESAGAQPEAAEVTAEHEVAASEPEPAVSAAESEVAQPEAAEVTSEHEVAASEPEPAESAAEPAVRYSESWESTTNTENRHARDSITEDEIAAAIHNLDHAAEPPAAPFEEGSEQAA